ncbi:MAG: biotin--[acetyl-CoA-carboxylase] ligase [Roseburia sp.]|nr:biotin--[acetyl-CoA-carboxylase] ligase [Roseburia sp.]
MKSEILAALRGADDYVSGQYLCEKLGVSRTAVWKGIQKLRQEGYVIEAVSNKGYRLAGAEDVLNGDELKSRRKTRWIGEEIYYFGVVDSTNIRAKQLADEGSGHGTLVVADRQEAGRGRRGKSWTSPAGTSVYMSILLKPEIKPQSASMLTLIAGLSVAKAIKEYAGLSPQIKWPNDIVINGKKVCGILAELSTEIDQIHYVVVGIGINVRNMEFPEEIAAMATSLFLEGKDEVKRAELIEAVCECFEYYYDLFCKSYDLSGLCQEYNEYLVNLGRQVKVLDPQKSFEGKALGITDTGELVVETEEGQKLVSAGEVSVRGIYGYV